MRVGFHKLDDIILAPPVGVLVGVLIAAGAWQVSHWLARRWLGLDASPLDRAASFVAVVALIAAMSHAIAFAGWHMHALLRIIGIAFACAGALGVYQLALLLPAGLALVRNNLACLKTTSPVLLIPAALIGLTFAALAFSALGPPTDGDSILYHVAVALDWLSAGHATARPDWLPARLVGIGESVILLGLAVGVEQTSAVFQASGLLVIYVAISSLARSREDRTLAALMIAACPAMIFLVPNQKPMLLPAAAVAVMFAVLFRLRDEFDIKRIILAATCGAFAVACKLSFLFAACIGFVSALVIAGRHRAVGKVLVTGAFVVILLPAPSWVRTYLYYGDPISPFLARFQTEPDATVTAFAEYLRDCGEPHTLEGYLRFIRTLVVPGFPGDAAHVLGIGAWFAVMLVWARGPAGWLASSAAAIALLEAVLGQLAPRFLLDAYLIAAMALVTSELTGTKRILSYALTVQCVLTCAMASYAALTLAPGALSPALRAMAMDRTAFGAEAGRWLDTVLPPDAVIDDNFHAHALLPRPFFDYQVEPPTTDDEGVLERYWLQRIAAMRAKGVNTIVYVPERDPGSGKVLSRLTRPLAAASFSHVARNPFNRVGTWRIEVLRMLP